MVMWVAGHTLLKIMHPPLYDLKIVVYITKCFAYNSLSKVNVNKRIFVYSIKMPLNFSYSPSIDFPGCVNVQHNTITESVMLISLSFIKLICNPLFLLSSQVYYPISAGMIVRVKSIIW